MESGTPFTTDRERSTDIAFRRGAMGAASSSVYQNKGIFLGVTHEEEARPTMGLLPEPLRREIVSTMLAQDTCPDEPGFELTTFAVESFGRLGEGGYQFINEIASHAAGGGNVVSMRRRGIIKEHILQLVSVVTQVTISRTVHRYKLSLRGRQHVARRQHANQNYRPP